MNLLLTKRFITPSRLLAGAAGLVVLFALAGIVARVGAAEANPASASGRLVTLHDRGVERVFATTKATLGEALEEAGVHVDAKDKVEPGLNEPLVAGEYTVNVYRARPMVVVDGVKRQKVITAAQVSEHIAKDAGVTLYPEDTATIKQSDNLLTDGASLQLAITRATPFTFTLYGETLTARTQAKTVGDMLRDKKIALGDNDRVSVSLETPITEGLEVRVWREGKQTITVDEDVAFQTEQIKDANREAGYKQVQTPGEKGKRSVTYEVTIQDGKEVARAEIASVTTKEAKKQVEVVGAKFNYTGGPLSEAQITALGMCESGMTATRNSGNGFYGAFQFMASTWRTVAPGEYKGVLPHEAPLDAQKQAVQTLLSRSSIYTQFPGCAKKMQAQGIL